MKTAKRDALYFGNYFSTKIYRFNKLGIQLIFRDHDLLASRPRQLSYIFPSIPFNLHISKLNTVNGVMNIQCDTIK